MTKNLLAVVHTAIVSVALSSAQTSAADQTELSFPGNSSTVLANAPFRDPSLPIGQRSTTSFRV